MKKLFTFLLLISSNYLMASEGRQWWSDVSPSIARNSGEQMIATKSCRYLNLDLGQIAGYLATAPMEFTSEARAKNVELELPLPDGSFQRFRIVESPVCAPELAARHPETRTWSGQGL